MAWAERSTAETLIARRSDARADARSDGLKDVSPVPQSSPHHSPLVAQHLIFVRQVAEHVLPVFGNENQVEQPFGDAWWRQISWPWSVREF